MSPPASSADHRAGEVRQQRIHQAGLADADDGDALGAVGREVHPRTPSTSSRSRCDLAGQFGAAAVDARLDGAFRQLQLIGDFLVGQLLDVAQHHRARAASAAAPPWPGAAARRDRAVRAPRRRSARRRRRQLAGVDVAIDRLALLAHAAVVIDAQVAADADQPGLEIGAPVERVQRLEDLEEDVLRQVLGFVVRPVNL